jgi:hypothetical protein
MKNTLSILLVILILISCKNDKSTSEEIEVLAVKEDTTAEAIANKNGYNNWAKVSELKFTFNVDRGERHFERSWIWKPKTHDITMITSSDTISYNQAKLDSITTKADASFINDRYWLLAPFHLVWDTGTTFSESKKVVAPLSKDTLNLLTIVYGNEGGYTPGDAYDLFYEDDFTLREWIFREGNDSIPSMTTTWEGYKDFNGITLSTMRKDSTDNFKLYFTNISVK